VTSIRSATAMSVLESIDREGIEYAVVRNHEQIPEEPGRDIDLMADMDERTAIERILDGAREAFGWESLVRCTGHHEGTSYYFIGPAVGTARRDQLEIHFTRVRWAGATILSPADVVARRIRADSGIWFAAPEHTVVQRVLQIGLSRGFARMKEEYWGELRELAERHTEGVVDALADALTDRGLASEIVDILRREDRAALPDMSERIRRQFLLAGRGVKRLRDLPGVGVSVARKAAAGRFPARCGVVARVNPSTPDEVIEGLRGAVGHMFLEVRVVDHSSLDRDRLLSEAAEVVAREGLLVVRASEPFDASLRWIPKVACWIAPGEPDNGADLVVRRFVANHRSVSV
jgi:hypothetical protein